MQHRDKIIIQKILSEIDIAFEMLGDCDELSFVNDEKLKRAVGMTVINIGELVKNVSDELRSENKGVQHLSFNQGVRSSNLRWISKKHRF